MKTLRPGEYGQCARKRRYSKGAARAVVIQIAKHQKDETIHAYHCPFCKGWHVGHPRGKGNDDGS